MGNGIKNAPSVIEIFLARMIKFISYIYPIFLVLGKILLHLAPVYIILMSVAFD